MIGFVALLDTRGGSDVRALVTRAAARLPCTGPGTLTVLDDGPAALAAAPWFTEPLGGAWRADGNDRLLLAGTVRLDARAELRTALTAAGHELGDAAGDELLLATAYRAWGSSMAEHLIGDYAFVVWDPARRTMLCARDPFGVRPLYFIADAARLACSSSIEPLRALPDVGDALNMRAVADFLREGYTTDPRGTIWRDVHRVAPGHTVIVSLLESVPLVRRHWDFPVPSPLRYRDPADYAAHYREVLGEAVRDRLRCGSATIQLSGGIDSPTLAVTARRVAPQLALHAYTFVNERAVPTDDERRFAILAARAAGATQEIEDLSDQMPFEHLDDPAFRSSEPLDGAETATWRRFAVHAATRSPVQLIGEDGDALFLPSGLRTMLRTQGLADVLADVASYARARGRLPHTGLYLRRRLRSAFSRPPGSNAPWIRPGLLTSEAAVPAAPAITPHPIRPESHARLANPLWQSLLESIDPSAVPAALDVRLPLIDPRVIAFVWAIPPIPWCQRKELARVAFRDDLPAALLTRRKTPLYHFEEYQVARWRARALPVTLRSAAIREFVDFRTVETIFQNGSVHSMRAAWRVLALDRWLADSIASV